MGTSIFSLYLTHIFIHWDPLCRSELRYSCLNVIPTLGVSGPSRIPTDPQGWHLHRPLCISGMAVTALAQLRSHLAPRGHSVPMPHSTKQHSHPAVVLVVLLTETYDGEQRSGTYPSDTHSLQLNTTHSRSCSLLVSPLGFLTGFIAHGGQATSANFFFPLSFLSSLRWFRGNAKLFPVCEATAPRPYSPLLNWAFLYVSQFTKVLCWLKGPSVYQDAGPGFDFI